MISSENGLLVVSVLLNVRGRDVGSFVEEAKHLVAQTVKLPQGSYIEWSGQYENEVRARQRLQIVIPVVLAVIYLLLYLTYHSLLEAAHVLLAVPFALSGGLYLLYALGYNMSVAVMVGFIALFGTAVQTAVVMVIYLEEAVVRKRQALGGRLTRAALLEAVTEGALLRLTPEGDDGVHRGGEPAAHHVEPFDRRRGDEAPGDPGARGHGQLAGPCAARDAGDLLLAAGAGAPSRRRQGSGRDGSHPPGAADPRIGRWTPWPNMTERRNT